jgi:hypothetical protein
MEVPRLCYVRQGAVNSQPGSSSKLQGGIPNIWVDARQPAKAKARVVSSS